MFKDDVETQDPIDTSIRCYTSIELQERWNIDTQRINSLVRHEIAERIGGTLAYLVRRIHGRNAEILYDVTAGGIEKYGLTYNFIQTLDWRSQRRLILRVAQNIELTNRSKNALALLSIALAKSPTWHISEGESSKKLCNRLHKTLRADKMLFERINVKRLVKLTEA